MLSFSIREMFVVFKGNWKSISLVQLSKNKATDKKTWETGQDIPWAIEKT